MVSEPVVVMKPMPRPKDDGTIEGESFDAGNPTHVKKAAKKAKLKTDQRKLDYQAMLATKAGRRVLWDVLGMCRLYAGSFNTNALSMAYAEGARQVGLQLLSRLSEADPESYARMQLDALKEEENV